ncbi:MAG: HAD-IIIC family phosphatase [Pseudomonadota bacterium]|mgnify:CR=1 FL=1|jgi:HAD-superfamily phosphatase, subfamily IIIC/FkbH-like domain|nr:MAG: GNAT family N-acetyltransferase [Pseudomonadota bacterium]
MQTAASAEFLDSLLEKVRGLDPLSLDPVEVRRISREARRAGRAADLRVAFAGNVVFDPLPEFLEAQLLCRGMKAVSYTAPFGQPLQSLLDPRSALRQFDPDFLLLHFELEALLPGIVDRRAADADCWKAGVSEVLEAIQPTVRAALDHTRAVVLLTNFAGPDCYELGIADSRAEFGEQEFFAQLNLELARTFRTEPRVQIVDLCRLTAWYGRGRARDRRMYYLAKNPWHEGFLPVFADEIVRHIGAALGRVRKCLVVDLDNTLWSGVLGEDGPEGIRVGRGDPVAEAHYDLQRRILALRKRGILLAICSKNNPEDVEEVFRVRRDMPLRREDFVAVQVGWENKHEGLRRIAEQLNIGTDSLVFLDDNPAEIELIRQTMPEVECVLLPEDPAQRPMCLDRVHGLDRAIVTAEDLAKTRQYQENAARDSERLRFDDIEAYLHSLRTCIGIRRASPDLMPRAHQLFTKTNQFNVTTRRYSLEELRRFAADPTCRLWMVRAADRFGELGWIAAVLVRDFGRAVAHIDSFVLSCRAMGRGIETAILNYVKRACFESPERVALTAELIPTARNLPVRELYETQGFTVVERREDGAKRYRLERAAATDLPCSWIEIEES